LTGASVIKNATMKHFLTDILDAKLQPATETQVGAHVLTLFERVAAMVPAYRDFLLTTGVDPSTITSLADFRTLPYTNKQNYNQKYKLADLCRDGRLDATDMIAVSSGASGAPTFWLRAGVDEEAISVRFAQIFHDSFRADERLTLAVVCFPLGTWVGGMYTAACCRHLAAQGYRVVTVSPGNNKAEILRVVQALGPEFQQTVLLGYPPFVKDVVDSGIAAGVRWANYNVKMVFAGEVFSEEWRSLVCERVGAVDPARDTASLYGTADAGVLANETPLSISLRRFFAANPEAGRELFGESRLPTLAQYDPLSRYFEADNGTLLFTGDNGIPLIRYHIADSGGIVPFDDMIAYATDRGWSMPAELKSAETRGLRRLPFVYVFGRSLFAVSFYGANVYPENVMVGLEQATIKDWVTGKFVLEVVDVDDGNRGLRVTVELAAGVDWDDTKRVTIAESIRLHLRRLNSEFANYVPDVRQTPIVELRSTGDPEYFPVGIKHRYTR